MSLSSSNLLEENDRVSAIPLDPTYSGIWDNYERETSSFWTNKKIKFTEDTKNFANAPVDIQTSTLKVLAYFAGSDEIVEDILKKSALGRITIPEIKYILTFEAMMENEHSITYNKTIQAVVRDDAKRAELFNAVNSMPSVAAKAAWARQWITDTRPLDYTLVGKACVEAINFSASFAWIDWLKTQRYRFDGMYEANDEISRDEARHVETSCLIHGLLRDRIPIEDAKQIIDGAVAVEIQFIEDFIPARGFTGMNRAMMSEYVHHCAALLAKDLGYPTLYRGTTCPFGFMKLRSLNSKTNFFEKNETNYSIFGSTTEDNDADIESAFNV